MTPQRRVQDAARVVMDYQHMRLRAGSQTTRDSPRKTSRTSQDIPRKLRPTFLQNLPNIPLRPRPNIPLKPPTTEHAKTFLQNLVTYSSRGLVGCGVSVTEDRCILRFTEEEGHVPREECGWMFEEMGGRFFQEGRLGDRLVQTQPERPWEGLPIWGGGGLLSSIASDQSSQYLDTLGHVRFIRITGSSCGKTATHTGTT
ncbi:hypothetical protein DEU56DRAFT_798552 [Suillus clintonianus]|uniref:uncharacterized protein n=1 Tax=Suillus clintonianus TaxID=1904413 RepID=UPI001B872AEB|nr:uncharacterized protein DEU56DRAFT_798552 [Suillus clintonianus]KAG2140085.1 hypothetical protein DEU56DRAFT_798552 [Suillus clintonianus]